MGEARAPQHDGRRELGDAVEAMPLGQIGQHVGADDQAEARAGLPSDQRLDGEERSALSSERALDVAVRTVLDAELSAGDRRRLGRKVLSASRLSIVEGSFPGGGTSLVTVNVELRRADPEAAPLFISGAFTLDAAGTLATIVVPPKMRPQRHELEMVGDVDGDGMLDAVLTEIEEGAGLRKLVTWPGGAPASRVLPPSDFEGC